MVKCKAIIISDRNGRWDVRWEQNIESMSEEIIDSLMQNRMFVRALIEWGLEIGEDVLTDERRRSDVVRSLKPVLVTYDSIGDYVCLEVSFLTNVGRRSFPIMTVEDGGEARELWVQMVDVKEFGTPPVYLCEIRFG